MDTKILEAVNDIGFGRDRESGLSCFYHEFFHVSCAFNEQ
jgi:hypothetical protein